MFRVGRVTVRGTTRLSTAEIDALLPGLRGQHILRVDLETYGRRLLDSPWVASAAMRRVLPGTIEIRVVERAPLAIARIGQRLYLVDGEGVVMDEFGPEYQAFDLPVVDGLVDPGGAVDPGRAALTHAFLQALRNAPALRQRVSQIDVSRDGDVAVLLAGDPTLVHLGDTRFLDRLRTYEELAPTLQGRLKDIDYVDMRFDERVYVKSKGSLALATAKGSL
jgi:cell division protein FtsQ